MKKIIAILLAVAAIMTVFCACSKNPDETATTTAATTASVNSTDFEYTVQEDGTIKSLPTRATALTAKESPSTFTQSLP